MINKQGFIPRNFRKLSVSDRQSLLGVDSDGLLSVEQADKMIENVTGVFGLPQALVPNFLMNETLYQVPLVVEEPSVVIALNYASLLVSRAGGFSAECQQSLLVGQIQIVNVKDQKNTLSSLEKSKKELISKAN